MYGKYVHGGVVTLALFPEHNLTRVVYNKTSTYRVLLFVFVWEIGRGEREREVPSHLFWTPPVYTPLTLVSRCSLGALVGVSHTHTQQEGGQVSTDRDSILVIETPYYSRRCCGTCLHSKSKWLISRERFGCGRVPRSLSLGMVNHAEYTYFR